MNNPEEQAGFLSYILKTDYRFLQERDLGFDLYNSGWCGLAVFVLAIITTTIFFLAIFNVIPLRRHITLLLPGPGCLALAIGLLGTWLNYRGLDDGGGTLFSEAGGAVPVSIGQQAAIVILPLGAGIVTLLISVSGYLYLLTFWASALLRTQTEKKDRKKSAKADVRKPAKK